MNLQETMRRLHPASEPSAALAVRVESLAAGIDRSTHFIQPNRARRFSVAVAAGCAVAALAGIAFFTTPRETLARTMNTVYSNVQQAQGVHYRITFAPKTNGKTLTYEVWQTSGSRPQGVHPDHAIGVRRDRAWRSDVAMNGSVFTQFETNGMVWNIDWKAKQANYQKAGPAVMPPFDIKGFQNQVVHALHDAQGTNLGTGNWEGRQLQKIAVPAAVQGFFRAAPKPGRSIFWIDTKQLLPARIEQQLLENGQWRTVSTMQYDLAPFVPSSVFRVPSGMATQSVEELGARAGARFAQPIAQKRFAIRTIALRNVQINQEGDVFVLYTDGSTLAENREAYASLAQDKQGTVYAGTAGAIEPFMYHSDKISSRGMIVNGLTLKGDCFVPVTPPSASWEPHQITVQIHFVEYVGKKAYTRTATFVVPVPKPRTRLLPTYASDLAKLSLAGGDVAQFKQDREGARRMHFYNERDWQGMILSTDREIREGIVDTNTFLSRAEAFQKLRAWDQADAALAKAEQYDSLAFYAEQIAEARKRLRKER